MGDVLGYIVFGILPCLPTVIGLWIYRGYGKRTAADDALAASRIATAVLEFMVVWVVIMLSILAIILWQVSMSQAFELVLGQPWFAIATIEPPAFLLGIRLRELTQSDIALAMMFGAGIIICYLLLLSMVLHRCVPFFCDNPPIAIPIPWSSMLLGISSMIIFMLLGMASLLAVPDITASGPKISYRIVIIISLLLLWYLGLFSTLFFQPPGLLMAVTITYMVWRFDHEWRMATFLP